MKYTKEEYDKMVKIHLPMDDAYITGKKPEVINKMRASINKVKSILYLLEEEEVTSKTKASIDKVKIAHYLLEEVIVGIEETILEVTKL
jgi:hypothetical protein